MLEKWNPWWQVGTVPAERLGIAREEMLGTFLKLADAKEIVAINGVRRAGKSTLLYQIANSLILKGVPPANIFYFNFDEPTTEKGYAALEAAYGLFLEMNNPKGRKYAFFDELQNVPEWERWLKPQYDRMGRDAKFFITGSNSAMLTDSLAKLVTGRLLSTAVYPLSFSEFLAFRKAKLPAPREETEYHLGKFLQGGGFPEAVLEKDAEVNRQRLKDYLNSILFRDIVSGRGVKESAKLSELAQYAAANIGTVASYRRISETIGLNVNTLKEYLGFLQESHLVFSVPHFSYSIRETIAVQKPRKLYFIDNGMRNAIYPPFSRDDGRLAENAVFIELKRRGLDVFFWKGEKEVDFVFRDDAGLCGVNVTYGQKVHERETESLHEFRGKFGKTKLLLITKNEEKKEDGVEFVPLSKWLLEGKK